MSQRIYSGGMMAHCLSLYLCPLDGADIPKRGRGGDFKVSNLASAALRHGRNTDILMMLL